MAEGDLDRDLGLGSVVAGQSRARLPNGCSSQLIDLEVSVLFSAFKGREGKVREFVPLNLERQKVAFFPLSWTVVHPIDPSSPIFGMTYEDLLAIDAEFRSS
jgi:inward rectifier potassium channel